MNTLFSKLSSKVFLMGLLTMPALAVAADAIEVYKSPYCGCCEKWVDHMQQHGFEMTIHNKANLAPIKEKLGVVPAAGSCHTASIAGYFIEGHVPAEDVKRLLEEKPDIRGIAVAGMPMGSPGMEGHHKAAYDVITVHKDGSTSVFNNYK
ncbi:DUF411 domain-containing protein [Corallincola holothuriorum]|uniref:DUF411 domain-containing protein n=1 Tax=Corallincola holothuriorum TaxID=2282215 RepID=A0A368NKA2_9GAMM|nr:DUF411 domain-containing protein [Corallincola holothuriorum]RCU51042.1 DUF411 domain-containing protein [Corallincola holothuriorum]